MSEATFVALPHDTAIAPTRRLILFSPPSLYRDAVGFLIERRCANTTVTMAIDENVVLVAEADVVVFDVDVVYVSDGVDQLAATLQKFAPRPVLLITEGMQPAALQRLLREGVAGVVLKSSPSDTLIEAIEAVSSGKVWLQLDLLAETFGESSHIRRRGCSQFEKIAQLTQREREIIAVASAGVTNRQIGSKLNISEATVRHHLSSVFAKLGVANRGELMIFSFRHGLAGEAQGFC